MALRAILAVVATTLITGAVPAGAAAANPPGDPVVTVPAICMLPLLPDLSEPTARPPRDHTDALFPDLVAAKPKSLELEEVDGRWQLGFTSGIENHGAGPLIVEGEAADQPGEMDASQRIQLRDGGSMTRPVSTPLRFSLDGDHNHWHFPTAMRYEIRTAAGEPVGTDVKSGFCLGDRYEVEGLDRDGPTAYTTNCGANAPSSPSW